MLVDRGAAVPNTFCIATELAGLYKCAWDLGVAVLAVGESIICNYLLRDMAYLLAS